MFEHEQPDCRGQIAVLTFGFNVGNDRRQGRIVAFRNILQARPELILKTNACLMAADNDGPFYNRGLQVCLLAAMRFMALHTFTLAFFNIALRR